MRSNGLVSVGHLIGHKKSRTEYVSTLRHFVKMLNITLDDGMIDKPSTMWKYEEFFKSADMSLGNFANFLNGIMRKPDADEIQMQLLVEKIVWSMVKTSWNQEVHFKAFCIFNRFCDPMVLPLEIGPNGLHFVYKYLGLAHGKLGSYKLDDFLALIDGQEIDHEKLNKLYDEVVLDILISGCVQGKLAKGNNNRSSLIKTTSPLKLELSSKCLRVGQNNEFFPLHQAEVHVTKSSTFSGLRTKTTSTLHLNSICGQFYLFLVFDSPKEDLLAFKWHSALQETIRDLIPNGMNRLAKIYQIHEIRESFFNPRSLHYNRFLEFGPTSLSETDIIKDLDDFPLERRNSYSEFGQERKLSAKNRARKLGMIQHRGFYID